MGVIMYRNNRYAGGGSADPSLHFDWSNQTLPQTGDTNTIYCIPTGDTSDPWDFYAWNDTDEEFVKIDFNMTISIDSALSDTSTNPVQNRVVKGAIDAKADNTQTFTEASTRANIASGETFAVILGKIKKFFTDLKAVAFSGSYNDLSDQPTIPAAQVNSDWNASSGVAEILNKPSSMPASDVYAWAKAATKPSYTASEVGALASNGTAVKATADADGNTISSTYMKKGVDRVTAGQMSGSTLGTRATAEGYDITASGLNSHGEGSGTTAEGENSHAEGNWTFATGFASHTEGEGTRATQSYSHAEGYHSTASKNSSHAEGYYGTASGLYSHVEGSFGTASGSCSHAEGYNNIASGNYSHAEGYQTKASSAYQHVEGKYNVEDANDVYAHIIGNGSSNTNRSNAFMVSWAGYAIAQVGFGLSTIQSSANLNIDTINNDKFYLIRMITGSGALGSQPTSVLGGNAYILMGFSQINTSNNKVFYGVQLAIGFGSSKIAMRNCNYNSTGTGSWSAWVAIT